MSSNLKFWIGAFLLSLPFFGIFALIIVAQGWVGVLIILGIFAVLGMITVGGYLVSDS